MNYRSFRLAFCEFSIEFGLAFLLAVSPFLFGSVLPWAATGLQVGIVLIFVSYLARERLLNRRRREEPVPGLSAGGRGGFSRLGSAGLVLFILGALLQLIPLPPAAIRSFSPSTLNFYLLSGRPAGNWIPISLFPRRAAAEAVRVLSCLAAAWVVIHYRPLNKTRAVFLTRLILVVIAAGFVLSLAGIIQKYGGGGKLYGIFLGPGGHGFGPYVNRNHFAGYIGMVIPLALAAFVSLAAGAARSRSGGLRSRIIESDPRRLVVLFVALVMIVALFLSLSRGGIATFLASMIYFVVLSRRLQLIRRRFLLRLSASFLILLILAISYFGYQPLLERFEDFSSRGRVITWKDTWNLFRRYPVLGTGLGTFREVFRRLHGHYQPYRLRHPVFHRKMPFHAENEYLQLLAEMGIWGGGSVLILFVSYFHRVLAWRPRRRERPPFPIRPERRQFRLRRRAIVLGTSTAVVALSLHAVVDFNLHIPANAFLFCVLAGASLSIVEDAG